MPEGRSDVTHLTVIDIGGTHARFAPAQIGPLGIVLGEPVKFRTSDHVSLQTAWEAYQAKAGAPLPRDAAIAIAAPVNGQTVRMTNNTWSFRPDRIAGDLGLERMTLINDFGAVAHAVARADAADLVPVAGPDAPLPGDGTVSVIGPGTGLGVAHFHRHPGGYHVQATEGAHVDFAPVDPIDDMLLADLRQQHRRVSLERVVSGPGIVVIRKILGRIEQRVLPDLDDKAIWESGIDGTDALCRAAVERFCQSLGSVCGDYALAHGSSAVVLAGGLVQRLRDLLPVSGFAERFVHKGRYEHMMSGIPVRMLIHPEPGLLGAAAAFASEHP
ncbi:glucokinase [Tsuneonella sp. HG222]